MARFLVEHCLCLDMAILTKRGALQPGFGDTYRFYEGEEEIESICWEFLDGAVCLHYPEIEGYSHLWVKVSFTETGIGGKRAWFHCPGCHRRVSKLFRPPRGDQDFKCRACHDLTYASQHPRTWDWSKHPRPWADMPLMTAEEEAELAGTVLETLSMSLSDFYAMVEAERASARPRRGRPKVKRPYNRSRPFARGEKKSPSQRLCMRCRDYREIEDPQAATLPNGRPALKGHCPVCGAKMTAVTKGR